MSAQSLIETHRAADPTARRSFIDSFLSNPTSQLPHSPHEISTIDQIEQSLSTSKGEEDELDDDLLFPKFVGIKDSIMIGTCTGVVQTTPEDLLAFLYLADTHQARESHIAANGPDSSKYPNKTIYVVNDLHKINYSCRKLPPPLKPRDWLTRNIVQLVDANTIKSFATSINDDDPELPPSFTKTSLTKFVRGEITAMHKYERLPHNQTRFTLRLRVDLKGSVPKTIANMGMSGALDSVYRAYKYFQRDEEIDELEVSLEMLIKHAGSLEI